MFGSDAQAAACTVCAACLICEPQRREPILTKHYIATILSAFLVISCTSDATSERTVEPYDGITESETIKLVGNEPFWGMTIEADQLNYSTPENIEGSTTTVTRFAGNNGLGFAGSLDRETLQVAVTPGSCNDTMSDRTYPFTATVTLGDRTLTGCAYSDTQPYQGEENP